MGSSGASNSATLPLLEARDSATGDVSPTSAFVHVVLTGNRFFSGRAAFAKAEELRQLTTALEARGIPGYRSRRWRSKARPSTSHRACSRSRRR